MKYFIIAGEASGDLHAANLMRELKLRDPKADFCFLGGDLMTAIGGQKIIDYRQMAFMGFIPVLRNLRTVLGNMKKCQNAIVDFAPDVLILVDYPSFNLRIAKFVKEKLSKQKIPVLYYISPKIWAWKEWRIKAIRKYVDKIYSILPFETAFFAKHNVVVQYVGNPTVDSISAFYEEKQTDFETFCHENHLENKPIIAILAGSRKQEISHCLPKMLAAAASFSEYQIVLAGAPAIDEKFYRRITSENLHIMFGKTYELLAHSSAAVVNSGTATLETALIGTPQVVVYQVFGGKFAYFLKNLLIHVKYISLVNLIAEKEVVRELVQHHFTINNVKAELHKILFNPAYRVEILNGYAAVKQQLGAKGAARNAAEAIIP